MAKQDTSKKAAAVKSTEPKAGNGSMSGVELAQWNAHLAALSARKDELLTEAILDSGMSHRDIMRLGDILDRV